MKLLDLALAALLVLALGQAVLLARGGVATGTFGLLGQRDPHPSLQGPDGASRAIRGKVAAIGDFLTIEDLARGVLALEKGQVPGVPPLDEGERIRVRELVTRASGHRDELLATEAEIAAVEAELGATAREIAATLAPEQRAWVVAQRDAVSVGRVEQAYWDELLAALEER